MNCLGERPLGEGVDSTGSNGKELDLEPFRVVELAVAGRIPPGVAASLRVKDGALKRHLDL